MNAGINGFAIGVHQNSIDHGFWDAAEGTLEAIKALQSEGVESQRYKAVSGWIVAQKLALIHAEVSEALEEDRDGNHDVYYNADSGTLKPEGIGIELADVIIRTLDLMQWLGLDVEELLMMKARYNQGRPHMHGKSY